MRRSLPLVLVPLVLTACGSSDEKAEHSATTTRNAAGDASGTTGSTETARTTALPPQPPETVTLPAPTTPNSSTTLTSSSPVVEQSVCPSEQRAGTLANFGHRRSMSGAEHLEAYARRFGSIGLAVQRGHRRTKKAAMRLKAEAQATGFQNLQVQQDRCFDCEVDLHGNKTAAQRREFAAETRRAGFKIQYELG